MSSPPRLQPNAGISAPDVATSPAASTGQRQNRRATQQPSISEALRALPARPAGTQTPRRAGGSSGVREPTSLSDVVVTTLFVQKAKLDTALTLVRQFERPVSILNYEAWSRLDAIHTGKLPADDEKAARLVEQARDAAVIYKQQAAETLSNLMRSSFGRPGVTPDAMRALQDNAVNVKARIDVFIETANFITSSREEVNAINLASAALFDDKSKLRVDIPTEQLLKQLNAIEEKKVLCARPPAARGLQGKTERSLSVDRNVF